MENQTTLHAIYIVRKQLHIALNEAGKRDPGDIQGVCNHLAKCLYSLRNAQEIIQNDIDPHR